MDSFIRNMERKWVAGEPVVGGRAHNLLMEYSFAYLLAQLMRLMWHATDIEWDYDIGIDALRYDETTRDANGTYYWRRGWTGDYPTWTQVFPVYGPVRIGRRSMGRILAEAFDAPSAPNRWGNASGTKEIFGVTFVLSPPNGGSHRLKVKCPACNKLVGFGKWRQHAKHKH